MAPTLKFDRRSQKEIRCFGSSSMYNVNIYMCVCEYMYICVYIYTYTHLSLSLPTYLYIIIHILQVYIYIFNYFSMCLFEGETEYKIVEQTFLETSNDSGSPQPWRPRVIHTGSTGCTMQWTQMSALSWLSGENGPWNQSIEKKAQQKKTSLGLEYQ